MTEKNMHPLTSTGIAVLRIVAGLIFVMHGWRKAMAGFDAVSASFEGMGVFSGSLALAAAVAVTLVELIFGALLILGFKTRWVAVPLAVTMAVAMLVVHLPKGFFVDQGGFEFTLILLAALVMLMLSGAGSLSVDRLLRKQPAPSEQPIEVTPAATAEPEGVTDDTSQTVERERNEPPGLA